MEKNSKESPKNQKISWFQKFLKKYETNFKNLKIILWFGILKTYLKISEQFKMSKLKAHLRTIKKKSQKIPNFI